MGDSGGTFSCNRGVGDSLAGNEWSCSVSAMVASYQTIANPPRLVRLFSKHRVI
jgi:hypothetical protein